MRTYRLARARRVATALTGEGARIAGGRWNAIGVSVVYLAEDPGTAVVEGFVHIADVNNAPTDYHVLTIEVPDKLVSAARRIEEAELPDDWRQLDHPACQAAAARWLEQQPHPALCRVPSAVVPTYNLLLDPAHPDAARVRIIKDELFQFDPRMFRR